MWFSPTLKEPDSCDIRWLERALSSWRLGLSRQRRWVPPVSFGGSHTWLKPAGPFRGRSGSPRVQGPPSAQAGAAAGRRETAGSSLWLCLSPAESPGREAAFWSLHQPWGARPEGGAETVSGPQHFNWSCVMIDAKIPKVSMSLDALIFKS